MLSFAKFFGGLLALALIGHTAAAQSEAEFQEWLCSGRDKETATGSGTSVDCVIGGYAIEIDWSDKWAEAIGQSLFYAQALGFKPGVILLCHPDSKPATCHGHGVRLNTTADAWGLPIQVWACPATAREFADCEGL